MDRDDETAATARLVVQMTPQEKKALDGMAKRAGIPISEFVRRRLNADDLEPQREEIEALLAGIEAGAPEILAAVDRAIETVQAASASLDAMRAKP